MTKALARRPARAKVTVPARKVTSRSRSNSLRGARRVHGQIGRFADEVPEHVTLEEVRAALEGERDLRRRALIWFLWRTGARVSEALALSVDDINTHASTVRLVTLKRHLELGEAPKGRTLPVRPDLLAELAKVIAAYGVGGQRLSSSRRLRGRYDVGGRLVWPWTRQHAFRIVRDALMRAGVERARAHPHVLRHGHAVHAVRNRTPLNAVQAQLGHASLVTTNRYVHASGEDLREAYEVADW